MNYVIDASAVLASILGEPGADRVRAVLADRPGIASVNLGEVAHRLTMKGRPCDAVARLLDRYPLTVIDVDRELALEAGFAATIAKPFGLSFADRICLLLSKRLGLPILTGDREWLKVAPLLGVQVEMFR